MAHYAKVENGVVTQVIVADQEFIDSAVLGHGWVQTSYNTRGNVHYGQDGQPDGGVALNKNYAGVGYTWDGIGFAAPQPFPSWTLNSNSYVWEAPVSCPNDGRVHTWNENQQQWIPAES